MKLLYDPPLPFLGQKRRWIKYLPEIINGDIFHNGFSNFKKGTWIDLFGGSGLLSYNIKQICPKADVIYNDFDGYSNYLNDECFDILNQVADECCQVLKKYSHCEKNIKLDLKDNDLIKGFIDKAYKENGDKFYHRAILRFFIISVGMSSTYDHILKWCYCYNKTTPKSIKEKIKTERIISQNYLNNLIVKHNTDFKELIQKYKDNKNAVLIADPPYLNTYKGDYKGRFSKKDFEYLVENLRPPFIVFSSNKNNLADLLLNKFKNAKLKTLEISGGRGRCGWEWQYKHVMAYTDQMIYCVE